MSKKTIYFMRHGETEWNRAARLQGRADIPLNDIGRAQALAARDRLTAAELRFDRVIASTLVRAVQTAALAADLPESAVERDERIVEMGFGPFEGESIPSLPKDFWGFVNDPAQYPRPAGMETAESMEARLSAFLQSLAEDPRDETVLVVTHGVAIRALLSLLMPELGSKVWSMPIDNCVLYRTQLLDGHYAAPSIVQV